MKKFKPGELFRYNGKYYFFDLSQYSSFEIEEEAEGKIGVVLNEKDNDEYTIYICGSLGELDARGMEKIKTNGLSLERL